jgi:hypothetical protein
MKTVRLSTLLAVLYLAVVAGTPAIFRIGT